MTSVVAELREELRAPVRWPALDGVRGAAVGAIVLYHAFRLANAGEGAMPRLAPALWAPVGAARFGVDAFFVLSGFLVVRSWRVARTGASRRLALRQFLRRRAARVLPAYWVSLAVLVPLVAPSLLHDGRRLLLFVTVNQYVEAGLPAKVNAVSWSLTTEWHFYLLVPLIALAVARFGRWPVLAACLAGSVWWWTRQPFGLPASSIFGRIDQFVAGAVAADLVGAAAVGRMSRLTRALHAKAIGLLLIAGIAALGAYHGSTLGTIRATWLDPLVHPLVGLGLAAGLARILTRPRATVLDRPALRGLGLVSYSLYLAHYPIIQHGLRWAGLAGGQGSPAARVAAVLVLVSFALAVAVVGYAFVERPFLVRRTGLLRATSPDPRFEPGVASAPGRRTADRPAPNSARSRSAAGRAMPSRRT